MTADLEGLSQRVRARFKGGRVVSVDGTTVTFGVPNAIYIDRCGEVKGDVEAALSTRFGQPISIEITVEDSQPAPPDPAKLEPKPAAPVAEDPADIGPISELADATDTSSRGVDRITQAFPGSQVVETPPS